MKKLVGCLKDIYRAVIIWFGHRICRRSGLKQSFEFLEHTADLRLKIFGQDLRELFCHAAAALAGVAAEKIPAPECINIKEKIEITAPNTEAMLVDFLNEILARMQINRAVYPKVKILELDSQRIKAEILGGTVERFKEDIKAVTYHGAKIEKTANGYEVSVLFDV